MQFQSPNSPGHQLERRETTEEGGKCERSPRNQLAMGGGGTADNKSQEGITTLLEKRKRQPHQGRKDSKHCLSSHKRHVIAGRTKAMAAEVCV